MIDARLWLVLVLASASSWAGESPGHMRVLAASCAACHGAGGNSVGGTPVLAGLDRGHFLLQMSAFRDGSRSSTVMHHHAKGLTYPEIESLADYFAAQPRTPSSQPMPVGGR